MDDSTSFQSMEVLPYTPGTRCTPCGVDLPEHPFAPRCDDRDELSLFDSYQMTTYELAAAYIKGAGTALVADVKSMRIGGPRYPPNELIAMLRETCRLAQLLKAEVVVATEASKNALTLLAEAKKEQKVQALYAVGYDKLSLTKLRALKVDELTAILTTYINAHATEDATLATLVRKLRT